MARNPRVQAGFGGKRAAPFGGKKDVPEYKGDRKDTPKQARQEAKAGKKK
jgi:hypothetical protein